MCEIDWIVAAAWLQAIGSIGAIVAAIFIFRKQHHQNIALVESERQRVRDERTCERLELRALVLAEVGNLQDSLNAVVKAVTENKKTSEGIVVPEGGLPLSTAVSNCAKAGRSAVAVLTGMERALAASPSGAVACLKLMKLSQEMESNESALNGKQSAAIRVWAVERLTEFHAALNHIAAEDSCHLHAQLAGRARAL